jgi:predicted ATP-grasp superfamily ATP-dependent carboligase
MIKKIAIKWLKQTLHDVEMAKDIGYSDAHIKLFRIRRSTTHDIPLPEEIIVMRK